MDAERNEASPLPGITDLVRRSRQEVEAAQTERLRNTLQLCQRGHPFYRQRWRAAGIAASTIRTLDDLARLPLTLKQDFMSDPEAFRVHLPDLSLHERAIWEVMYTTGTTSGQPSIVYTTTHDHYTWLFHAREAAKFDGITSRDLFVNLYPLTALPMGAFVRAPHSAFAVGAAIVDAFPGTPYPAFPVHNPLEWGIELIQTHRATAIQGVASYVRRLLIRARELEADFSSVRLVFLGGEAASPAMRQDVRGRLIALGAREPRIVSRYGSTEIGIMCECTPGAGWHNPTPDLLYLEVVDEAGRPLPDGQEGLLALTHLNRRGTVLVRYVVGDVTVLDRSTCPHCGRNGERIVRQPVRTRDLIKVKGMLINPDLIQHEMALLPEVGEYQVVFTRQDPGDALSMDELVLKIAPAGGASSEIGRLVAERVAAAVAVRPRVELVEAHEIFDPEKSAKPVRIVDLR